MIAFPAGMQVMVATQPIADLEGSSFIARTVACDR
jgi:hypothetical protein